MPSTETAATNSTPATTAEDQQPKKRMKETLQSPTPPPPSPSAPSPPPPSKAPPAIQDLDKSFSYTVASMSSGEDFSLAAAPKDYLFAVTFMDSEDNSHGVLGIFPTYREAIHCARTNFLHYLIDLVASNRVSEQALTDGDTLSELLENLEIENAGHSSTYSISVEPKRIKRENLDIESVVELSQITEFGKEADSCLRKVFKELQSDDPAAEAAFNEHLGDNYKADHPSSTL